MDSALFDYDLPPGAIAQTPAERRDAARLLVVERRSGRLAHHRVCDLPDLLGEPYLIFRNNARVLRARLFGRRDTGGGMECLLLRPAEDPETWWCLLRPGKKLPRGAVFFVGEAAEGEVLEKTDEGPCRVRFRLPPALTVPGLAERHGRMPLPPYIRREKVDDPHAEMDRERYDTVYAQPDRPVAAAAPTAGLHFTPELLTRLEERGHTFHDLTLHVGLDTFRPIQTEQVEDHAMHAETYELPVETARALAHPAGRRRLAIGTTSLRASEDFLRHGPKVPPEGPPGPLLTSTRLYVYPPAELAMEALLTNFHLPRSTLLCLVSAFLTPGETRGIAWLKEIYAEALAQDYRFYSYGDAMLIL
ncbi:MAG: tRNA preQ1(34) S-adenosylmethionine ribosyltransferase-isomerase QueA [Opitutales bacterium]